MLARANLLDREELAPGGSALPAGLESPPAASGGRPADLRSYSPMITIGGGAVLDIAPPRHKRYRPEVIEALEARTKGAASGDLLADLLLKEATVQSVPLLPNWRKPPSERPQRCWLN